MASQILIAGRSPANWRARLRKPVFHARVVCICLVVVVVFSGRTLAQESAVAGTLDDTSAVYTSERLLRIDIRLDPDDWKALRISHRTPDPEKITEDPYIYYRADVEIDGVLFESVGLRKKGFFGSVVSTRPSLKIRFDEWNKDQLFHGLDQLTLNNNVQDPGQMHQYLAYWLFHRAGAVAPRCNFAIVSVNGKQLGIYSNVESIRDPFLERVFGDSQGKLYEGYAGDLADNETEFKRIVRKNGKPDSGRKALRELRDRLGDPDTDLEQIAELVDLDAFVTFWATEVLMGHWDSYSGNRNNYYLYRNRDSNKFYFIPWGADSIFQDPGPFIRQPVPRSVKAVGAVCRRLWQFPEIRQKYASEMQRLLQEVWIEDEILAETDRIQSMLGTHMTIPAALVRNHTGAARRFIKTRRGEFLAELEGELPEWPEIGTPEEDSAEPGKTMVVSGSFETTLIDEDPEDPFANGSATIQVEIDGKEITGLFKQVGVSARPEQPGFIRPGYPVISLMALGSDDRPPWYLQFFVDPIRMDDEGPELAVDHFCVWAMLIQGEFSSPDSQRRIFGVTGILNLNEMTNESGGTVSGTFRIETPAFRGLVSD